MEYFGAFFFMIFATMFGMAIFNGSSKFLRNQGMPEKTVSAKLSDKRIQENQSRRFGISAPIERETYYITFTTEDENVLIFMVTSQDFYDFEIGTKGKVSYQGSRYKGFKSDEN